MDDTADEVVKLLPRIPVAWQGLEAENWPILAGQGMVRADIRFERQASGSRLHIHVRAGDKIPALAVRLPTADGYAWKLSTDARDLELSA